MTKNVSAKYRDLPKLIQLSVCVRRFNLKLQTGLIFAQYL